MKTTKFIYIAAIGAAVMTSACKKNYLDLVPTDQVSDASIVGDSTVFEAYFTNRYMVIKIIDKEGEGTLPGFGRAF